jgi:hypothetical protein
MFDRALDNVENVERRRMTSGSVRFHARRDRASAALARHWTIIMCFIACARDAKVSRLA